MCINFSSEVADVHDDCEFNFALPAKQHSLISMPKNLRCHANTNAVPQQRCSDLMSDVMHA